MKPAESKKMLERLLSSVSTEEVEAIIQEQKFSDDDWKPYGSRDKNWDTVSNQQTSAVGALTELITNSIDAVLSRKAYESGIEDLSSDQAPQSMQEAVQKFYHVNEGKLSSLEPSQRTKLAEESILIGVKRKKKGRKYPTITVVDFGEGQNPEYFPKTFLSLSETNKEGIGFVQGKFNMGSTGSIRFCTQSDITQKHYKLIASKRYDGSLWGWTLIRVSEVQAGKKLPVVEYLMPNGEIPNFAGDRVKAFGDDAVGVIDQGSLVRLFEYDIGDGAHAVDFGLYRALTLNLLDCALPIRIYDFDAKPITGKGELRTKGIADRTFSGMGVMLRADFVDEEQQNPNIPEQKPEKQTTEFVHLVAELSDEELGTIKILATGLSELPEFIKSSKKRIFHTINGQTHATENASFLNRPKVKLADLQSHLIVNVLCEQMDKTALTMFMGNREQKIKNRLARKLDDFLQQHLSKDSKLREYQNIIKRRRAAQIIEEDEETKKMLSDLLTQDPSIRELLEPGVAVVDTGQAPGGQQEWKGWKLFPTFLKPLNVTKEGDHFVKELPINTSRQVKCGTDAANDYLSRSNSPGRAYYNSESDKAPHSVSLHNGTATFTFKPPSGAQVDDEIKLEIGFHDDGPRGRPLTYSLTLKITPEEDPKKSDTGKNTDTKDKKKSSIADPTEWVTKENWEDFEFNGKSGATVREGEDSLKVHVNRDHERLAEMRHQESDEAVRELNEARFKLCLGLLTLAVYRKLKQEDEEEASEQAKEVSDAIASYILPLIKTLGGAEQV